MNDRDIERITEALAESFERIMMDKDKLLRLEREEEKGLYGVDKQKMINVFAGLQKEFHRLLIENNMTKIPNYIVTKLLFMFITYQLTEMVRFTKIDMVSQIDLMSDICSNVSILLKLTMDDCHPQVQKTLKKLLPTMFKTLLSEGTMDEISKINDGPQRGHKMLEAVFRDLKEIDEMEKDKVDNLDQRRFWKDDIYKK